MAEEKVAKRLRRVVKALKKAGEPFAVVGGNAVAAYVARVDLTAVRTTRDIDVLVRRASLDRISESLEKAGFVRRDVLGSPMFVDSKEMSIRSGIHLIFAGEKVRAEHPTAAPELSDLGESEEGIPIVSLISLLRMKLNCFRDKDRVHLRDLLDVGLITPGIEESLPEVLRERLDNLKRNPE